MSSQRHGLKSRKLGFYDLLQTLAFKHCDGVVDIQRPPDVNGTDAVSVTFTPVFFECMECSQLSDNWRCSSFSSLFDIP